MPNVAIDPADPPLPAVTARSGSYALQGRPAQGLVLQQFARANGGVVSYLTWYSFDTDGRPMWMLGVSEGNGLSFDLIATRGARFLTLDPARVIREPWGRITLEAEACALTAASWQANDPRLGSGRALLSRLSDPVRASGGDCR
jgi:SLT domain-containing protein